MTIDTTAIDTTASQTTSPAPDRPAVRFVLAHVDALRQGHRLRLHAPEMIEEMEAEPALWWLDYLAAEGRACAHARRRGHRVFWCAPRFRLVHRIDSCSGRWCGWWHGALPAADVPPGPVAPPRTAVVTESLTCSNLASPVEREHETEPEQTMISSANGLRARARRASHTTRAAATREATSNATGRRLR
jgi:hypothetical protein